MTHPIIIQWIFTLLMALVPPEKVTSRPQLPGWHETTEQRTARYHSIAEDIVAVAFEDSEAPVEPGLRGRARTAALLATVAVKESWLAPDVDKGPCYRGPDGRGARCDHGQSYTLWQIMVGNGRTVAGFTGPELNADRKRAAREALHRMVASFRSCGRRGARARMNAYASGSCGAGEDAGLAHLKFWEKALAAYPPPSVPVAPVALPEVPSPAPVSILPVEVAATTIPWPMRGGWRPAFTIPLAQIP